MAVSDLIQQARARFGSSPSVVLRADQSTGEKTWEMFVIDEHTEHYLSIKVRGDSDRGMATGILAFIGGFGICMALFFAMQGKWQGVFNFLLLCTPLILGPFLWETRRPLPLPILFNRRTREVYFDHNGELYHTPWDGAEAVAGEFMLVGSHTDGMHNASLELLVRRLGEPDNALLVSLGLPMGKTLQMQKGFWEWLRAYMDNGPWFDENGQRSESDAYVKSMLAANVEPTGFLSIVKVLPRRRPLPVAVTT
ncbi:hypothetical protein [Pseudomonas sp. 5P_3.1_Bac2]|uniref:hypothetical protein n=1 Tax=Pseudomonas sp. 5P_3.1_Bac2 TaxID=2971617 RepID=UPI0021C6B3FB|nr:hypothetical protein [Pseudomonas sp. 5P_3.1_Bac2]MCU1718613.1 hypothetical protein [Pseudomonas sp. 5P_3.1_Bac2]